MPLKIVSPDQPITIKTISVLICGSPGQGKSTLAMSASKALCLDFDNGAHRSQFRHDVIRIESWGDLRDLNEVSLKPYNTIIVDTVGVALDFLIADIGRKNPKLLRDHQLTLQGYGELKGQFIAWVKRLSSFGKDVVFIAHEKEEPNGDDLRIRPDIIGGSRNEIFKMSDGIGRLCSKNGQRILDFNPSDEVLGKNPAQLEPLVVPNFHDEANWFAGVIERVKGVMGQVAESQAQAEDLLERFTEDIGNVKDAADANEVLVEINGLDKGTVVTQIKRKLNNKIKKLELEWNKAANSFQPKPPAEETGE